MAAQPMVCSLRQALSEPEYQQSADQFLDQKAVMIVRGCTRPQSPKGEAVHLVRVQIRLHTTYLGLLRPRLHSQQGHADARKRQPR